MIKVKTITTVTNVIISWTTLTFSYPVHASCAENIFGRRIYISRNKFGDQKYMIHSMDKFWVFILALAVIVAVALAVQKKPPDVISGGSEHPSWFDPPSIDAGRLF
jgi:hypothetical protein